MIKTIEDLQIITQSPDYQAIVLGSQGGRWQNALNAPGEAAVRLHAWETLQAMAVIFQTYEGLVEKIELDVEVLRDEDGEFSEANLIINGNDCMRVDDIGDFDLDFQDDLDAVDNMEALEDAIEIILNLPSQAIVDHFEAFRDPTNGVFTSAQQARERAELALGPLAGRINPLLVDLAHSQQASAPKPPGL